MGDEAFKQLSAMDPKGNELLDEVISLSILEYKINPVIHLQAAFMCFLFAFFHRPWLQIRVTSGLPNTTSRRLQRKDICVKRSRVCSQPDYCYYTFQGFSNDYSGFFYENNDYSIKKILQSPKLHLDTHLRI